MPEIANTTSIKRPAIFNSVLMLKDLQQSKRAKSWLQNEITICMNLWLSQFDTYKLKTFWQLTAGLWCIY